MFFFPIFFFPAKLLFAMKAQRSICALKGIPSQFDHKLEYLGVGRIGQRYY